MKSSHSVKSGSKLMIDNQTRKISLFWSNHSKFRLNQSVLQNRHLIPKPLPHNLSNCPIKTSNHFSRPSSEEEPLSR